MKYFIKTLNTFLFKLKSEFISRDLIATTRRRLNPKIYDFCFFPCRNNLETLHLLKSYINTKLDILDIGCGNKPFEAVFEGVTNTYVGIDFSSNSKADIFQDLNSTLNCDNNSFDFIILSEVLEHISNPFHLLNEINRVIKPGGYVFISTPFCFLIHSTPFDFYRYTEYFYRSIVPGFGFNLIRLKHSNTIFSSPFLLINQIIHPIFVIPNFLKIIIFTSINLIIFFLEFVVHFISNIKFLSNFFKSFPIGYSSIYKSTKIS